MNKNITARNEKLAKEVIKGLESRQMSGYWAADKEEALKQALALIPEGSTVTMGGAMSAHEIGLVEALKKGNYNFIDRDEADDPRAAMLAAYDADVFLSSANAMTQDGVLVNIDGNANRVSAIAQGPKKVLFIVGMNKICDDVDGALKRARNVAAPTNAQRFGLDTPCAKLGHCVALLKNDNPDFTDGCKSDNRICISYVITAFQRIKNRITVVICEDELGY
jgi:L-lactate utilization protein LutB